MKQLLSPFAFLLGLPLCGFAQEACLRGKVVEADSGQPVAYASVSLRQANTGALTNEQGYFEIKAGQLLRRDSLIVNTLGYLRYAMQIDSKASVLPTIALTKAAVKAGTVTLIGNCRLETDSGDEPPIEESKRIAAIPGSQYAFLLDNAEQKPGSKIRALSLYVGDSGFPRMPFRIRLYRTDGANGGPGSDLLTENVVVMPPVAGHWYTVDLSAYHIVVPDKSCFVAIEYLLWTRKFSPLLSHPQYAVHYMKPYLSQVESGTWNFVAGNGWRALPPGSISHWYNTLLRIELAKAD